MPRVSGTIELEELSAPVTVVRDRWGVPHIRAANRDDLFFAQGYVQAQDRLFQMDLWRRAALGRVAEVLGGTFVERDSTTRRMQYRGDLEEEWAHYGPDTRAIVSAFVRGINARVADAQVELPEAFALAGWTPEPWQPEDLLARTDAFVTSGNAHAEVLRAQLIAELGVEVADALLPPAEGVRTRIPDGIDPSVVSPVASTVLRRVGTMPFFLAFGRPRVPPPVEEKPPAGSNAWVVSGRRSASGSPLLASDPHRLLQHPSLRYLVHLTAPGWDVAGATAPWLPGVVIGHNRRIAWSFTAQSADTQDFFVEQVNPENPRQVRDGNRWVDMTVRPVAIEAIGRKPLEYEEQYTSNGVIVAVDLPRHLAYALGWSGTAAGAAPELAALGLNQAESWEDFQAAVRRWRMPAVEFVYADVDGRVESIRASYEPVRDGWSGETPVPGWSGRYRWRGWQDADAPARTEPANVIVSANGDQRRALRISERIAALSRHSVDSLIELQSDSWSPDSAALVPLLARLSIPPDQGLVAAARDRLVAWDGAMEPEQSAAGLFVAWRERLLTALVALRVPSRLTSSFLESRRTGLLDAIVSADPAWFDGDPTAARDALLIRTLAEAVAAGTTAGPPPWHQVMFGYPLALTDVTRERFNVGPFSIGGSRDAVSVLDGPDQDERTGASFRLVVDLADWDSARVTQAPGQSELPDSPHFRDLAARWARGEYFPLLFSEAAVDREAGTTLILTPRP